MVSSAEVKNETRSDFLLNDLGYGGHADAGLEAALIKGFAVALSGDEGVFGNEKGVDHDVTILPKGRSRGS